MTTPGAGARVTTLLHPLSITFWYPALFFNSPGQLFLMSVGENAAIVAAEPKSIHEVSERTLAICDTLFKFSCLTLNLSDCHGLFAFHSTATSISTQPRRPRLLFRSLRGFPSARTNIREMESRRVGARDQAMQKREECVCV